MKVPRTQLATIIGERTLQEPDITKLAQEIAAYLLSENREHDLESLMRDVLQYRQEHGIVEAELVSAHEIGSGIDRQVQELLKQHYPTANQVIVRESRDLSVVGGLRVQLAHEQLDMTVRAKLDSFKRLTAEGNV